MARSIGLDVHRDFCQVAIADGGRARSVGRVTTTPEALELFAQNLSPTDRVVLEATGNALAIARIIEPHVAEVLLAHAKHVRAISHAKIKTDKIDARVLAQLLAADLIPTVWVGDERARSLRRLVSRRRGLVKRRTQIKNEIAAVLHRNLKGRAPTTDMFGVEGRRWLATLELPVDERLTVDGCLRQLDFLGEELAQIDRVIAERVVDEPDARRLMTIPGVHVTTAATLVAVIGDIRRFPTPRHLVGYLGLHPTIRQSGTGPARHGRTSKEGSAAARHVLVEAAWSAARTPGPLRAFAERTAARRGRHVAAVAVARKLAVLSWHLLSRARTTHSRSPVRSAASCACSSSPRARRAASPVPTAIRSGRRRPSNALSAISPVRQRPATGAWSPTGRPPR